MDDFEKLAEDLTSKWHAVEEALSPYHTPVEIAVAPDLGKLLWRNDDGKWRIQLDNPQAGVIPIARCALDVRVALVPYAKAFVDAVKAAHMGRGRKVQEASLLLSGVLNTLRKP
jgi:hypothetical protein